jgi:Xaa-Pro aminopeptidase
MIERNFELYRNRLDSIQNSLKSNEAFLLFASHHKIRNKDVEYKFRQDSDYYYCTGITESDGILFLTKDTRVHFSLPKDKSEEIWTGIRMGKETIKKYLNLTEAYDINEWDTKKEELFINIKLLYYFFGKDANRDTELIQLFHKLNKKLREGKFGPTELKIPSFLHEMRMIKSNYEIELVKESIRITHLAHIHAIQQSKPGMKEYELEAIIESIYLKEGAWGGGYGHIVAAGKNATILHYTNNNSTIMENDLILIDSGAEKDYYTADITRTFPASKKFTSPQNAIYDLVLYAQKEAIAKSISGTKFLDIHLHAVKILTQGLIDLKLLEGSLEKNLTENLYKKFYMHRTGHYLGIDVHDVGSYYIDSESRKIVDGQIITVEPGLYFDPTDETIPIEFRGIGIRIEDNVLIHKNSPIVLSKEIPKEINELEYLKKL